MSDEQLVSDLCDELLAKCNPKTASAEEFLGHQYDLGLGWVHFPLGFGGLGLNPKAQTTINSKSETIEMMGKGRHDPCVLPRAVPIVEAMAALVLVDHLLRHRSTKA